nr:hypothetical protein [Gammaproteobacteria bacterium]
VNGLPTDGSTVHVRLFYRTSAGWQSTDTQYTAVNTASPPHITSPVANSTLPGSSVTFNWAANGTNVLEWWLYIGTAQGGLNIHDSGSLGTNLSTTVNGLPTDGSTVHVRLFYRTSAGWLSIDTQYTAANTTSPPSITSPAANSTLPGSSVTFNWAANGTSVLEWWLHIGSAQGGSNIHDSGTLGTASTSTVNGLPTDGSTVHVRLWYRTSAGWLAVDSQYTSANTTSLPSMTSPIANSTLSGSSVSFNWAANGTSVLEWWLYIGSTQGGSNFHDSGTLGTALTSTVNGLPTDGSTVHVRLWYRTSAGWLATDTQYTASNSTPGITSPSANSTLSGSTETFNWAANGESVLEWWLYIGTAAGLSDIHDSGTLGTALTSTVNGLPTDGSTVHIRLWYRTSTGWKAVDTQYTAVSTFNHSETQLIDDATGGSCTGENVAVINMNSGANNLTVAMTFPGDIDMGVIEPGGTCVDYQAPNSANGGAHSGDVTNGGTETYTVTNGASGNYTVIAHYHGNSQNAEVSITGTNGTVNLAPKFQDYVTGIAHQENK